METDPNTVSDVCVKYMEIKCFLKLSAQYLQCC